MFAVEVDGMDGLANDAMKYYCYWPL